jgi:putative methionine-R-sulfoxide reductase with GAF domain
MSNGSTFDPEFFQKLLESAFAVQESGVKAQSLARIVEIQRSIKARHLDVDATMHLIAQCARHVASASGVAVGTLDGDQLVYVAGSGSAASNVGRRVMATFCASARSETRGEILRVEDASTDPRIEAAICRQFGANSLLIVPIYYDGNVAGVMEVLFDQAHSFHEQEARIYRLLAGLVGEAMSQGEQGLEEEDEDVPASSESLGLQPAAELMPAPAREVRNESQKAPAIVAPEMSPMQATPLRKRQKATTERIQPASSAPVSPSYFPLYGSTMRAALLVAGVLGVVSWILYRDRPSSMFAVAPVTITEPSPAEIVPPLPPKPEAPANSAGSSDGAIDASRATPVRYVAPRLTKQASAVDGGTRVRHFGQDVTVRYFDPKPVAVNTALHDKQVRRFSDDVTVHYFPPATVPAQGQESPANDVR